MLRLSVLALVALELQDGPVVNVAHDRIRALLGQYLELVVERLVVRPLDVDLPLELAILLHDRPKIRQGQRLERQPAALALARCVALINADAIGVLGRVHLAADGGLDVPDDDLIEAAPAVPGVLERRGERLADEGLA